jgi:hypothetical protein
MKFLLDQSTDARLIPHFRFVTKVRQDEAAVRAACTETWSNGQTEGQITKLKLVKRSRYGRSLISSSNGRSGPLDDVSESEHEPLFVIAYRIGLESTLSSEVSDMACSCQSS